MSEKAPVPVTEKPAAEPVTGPSHQGNDAARVAELRDLDAEATLREQDKPSAAEVAVAQIGETEKQRKHREAKESVLMVAKPTFDLLTPNWRKVHLTDAKLDTWADGITPALLKYFPDLDENLPPELVALLVTGMTFAPLVAGKVPIVAPVPEEEKKAA